jgi:hypothetical protein
MKTTDADTHLPHIEDLVIENGVDGILILDNIITELYKYIRHKESDIQINMKVDGAPAIYFGIDPRPEHRGRFFVTTKSDMNCTAPVLPHSISELKDKFKTPGDSGLYHKLSSVYRTLKPIYDSIDTDLIYECDMLFDENIKTYEDEVISYQPQLIKYIVSADSDIYDRVHNADIGICVHCSFTGIINGTRINLKTCSRKVDRIIKSSINSNAFIQGSYYNNLQLSNKCDANRLLDYLKACHFYIDKVNPMFDTEYTSSSFLKYIKMFINDQVRICSDSDDYNMYKAGIDCMEYNHDKVCTLFEDYLDKRWYVDIKNKKQQGILNAKGRYKTYISMFYDSDFVQLMKCTHIMIHMKTLLLSMFRDVDSKIGIPYIPNSDNTFKISGDDDQGVSNGEGFAIFVGSAHVKLVDRLEFSARNLSYGRFQAAVK